MRIEINQFDQKGEIGTGHLELDEEQLSAIVSRARQIAMLRREGKPLADALADLDSALVSAQVLPAAAPSDKTGEKITPDLVTAYSELKGSVVEGDDASTVTVSRAALDFLGVAIRSGMRRVRVPEWTWRAAEGSSVSELGQEDLDRVLARMAQVAKLGGAPTIEEAFAKYPMQFMEAYAAQKAEDDRERANAPGATSLVHLYNRDGAAMQTMLVPAGMNGEQAKAAVETALGHLTETDDIDALANQLIAVGFEPVEHVSVEVVLPSEQVDDAPRG